MPALQWDIQRRQGAAKNCGFRGLSSFTRSSPSASCGDIRRGGARLPRKPVTIMMPYGPGGLGDVTRGYMPRGSRLG